MKDLGVLESFPLEGEDRKLLDPGTGGREGRLVWHVLYSALGFGESGSPAR